jgi:hypothetical protein
VLFSEPERAAFRSLLDLGLKDAFRLFEQPEKVYSWWDYRMMAFRRNMGLRIDHILLSRRMAAGCTACTVDKEARKAERPFRPCARRGGAGMSIPLPATRGALPGAGGAAAEIAQEIAAAAQAVTVPSGATLFDERQPCQGFPFVLAGAIRVAKVSASGRELPLYRVTPGETCIITSSCLLGNVPYNARGTTESETVLVLLPQGLFTNCWPRRLSAISSSTFSPSAWPT